MSISRRALSRRQVNQRRRSFLRSAGQRPAQRRVGRLEALETRSLLASDLFISDYWNYKQPTDVNDDGHTSMMDILAVVNELTEGGARPLSGTTVRVGPDVEGESPATTASTQMYYVDPNNDGMLNMLDLLQIVNEMTAEGEHAPPIIRYKIEPVFAGTVTPLPQDASGRYLIQEGDYYELRILAQDTGQLTYDPDGPGGNDPLTRPSMFDPDGDGPQAPKTAFGLTLAHLDMFWDTSRTQIQVTETQIVEIAGSPTGKEISSTPTKFNLTFNGQQTADITYSLVPVVTADDIRDKLVALSNVGFTDSGVLRNVEVEPETQTSSTRFRVRFVYDLADQNFNLMTAALTTAAGATGVSVLPSVDGDPNSATAFREMFRGRFVRDQNSDFLPIINNPQFFNTNRPPPFISGDRLPIGFNDGGSASSSSFEPSGDRSGTQLVEVFRLYMQATDGDGSTPVSFVGSVAELEQNNNFNSVHGFLKIDPHFVVFDQTGDFVTDPAPQLLITEPISAVNDDRTINEGPGASITIDVLANDIDNLPPGGTKDIVLVTPLTPINPAQGTISLSGNQIVYTVPNGDFNGVVTFQYTIRDGVQTAVTDTGTVTITVKATNDPPLNSVPTVTQNINEDQVLVFSVAGGNAISVSDVDAANLQVTLTATNGVVNLGSITNLTVTGNGSGTVVVSGAIADLNAGLSGLTFTPTLHFNGQATLTVNTTDLGASAHPDNASIGVDGDLINISVAAVNDAPVNTIPGPQTTDELVPLVFNAANGNLISVADVDAEAAGSIPPFITVTVSTSQGGVLNATTGGGATITGNGSTSVTISGMISQVNAALNGLTYVNASPANDTLRVLTSDNGNTGAGGILTDDDTIQIAVLATTRPRAIPDVFPPVGQTINEGTTTIFLDVLANDLVHQSPLETPLLVGSPVLGSGFEGLLTQQAAGMNGIPREHYRYDAPDADFFGTITFTYTMNETDTGGDPSDGPSSALVTLTITNINDNPTANPDNYNTNEDQTLTVSDPLLGVLSNDTDPDNRPSRPAVDTLTAELVAGSAVGGSVTVFNADGTFTFVPTLNFNGTASFSYRVLDNAGGAPSTGLVTINVAPVADDPVANPDNYTTPEGINLSVNAASGLLANDTDADNLTPPLNAGLTVDVATVTQPAQGSVAVNADGSFTYTLPNNDFDGDVTFTYRVTDGTGRFSPFTTVAIDVTPVNDPPVAGNATYSAIEDQTLTITQVNGLLRTINPIVTDVDDALSTLTVAVVSGVPAGHTLVLNSNGSFSYTPLADFTGQVQFTYRASDEPGSFSNVGTITIQVAEVNDPPTANPDEFTTNEDTSRTITAAELLGDDTDPENDTLTISFVSPLSGPGTLVQNPNGSITFTPAPGFPAPALTGNVTFQYRVTDGPNQSNLATVTITVNEVNDNPIANSYTAGNVIKNINGQLITPSPLANSSSGQDAGVPGEVLFIQSAGGAGGATAEGGIVTTDGQNVFYSPATGFEGFDSFQYTISDSRGGTATATVTVEVLNFVPKTVGGVVFVDINNNGVLDTGDRRLANVRVELQGTTVVGNYSEFRMTNALGEYLFQTLAPGSYELRQIQPDYLASSGERVNTSSQTADSVTNAVLNDNKFNLAWNALDFDGNITGLNFLERGIDSAQLANSAGLLGEVLFTSSQNGMIGVTSLNGGVMDWSYGLNNWGTQSLTTIQLEVMPNGAIPSCLVTYNGVTKRVYQDPSHNGSGTPGSTPPAGSMARFRILGNAANGEYIIRLDGKLADFGFLAAAPVPQEAGEGESAPQMSDGEYREAADAVFAEEAWA